MKDKIEKNMQDKRPLMQDKRPLGLLVSVVVNT